MEPKFTSANGIRFAYFEEGSGPLVLLLHGFPDTAHTWDAVRPALAKAGFRAVSPFMRGYAPTEVSKNGAYDADTIGSDAIGLIDALGEKRAVIVGHDWGACAAYAAAALGPEHVSLLVTLAIPHPASLKPTPSAVWSVRHFFTLRTRGAAKRVRKNDFAEIDMLVKRWSPAWDFPAEETRPVKQAFGEPGSLEAALGYYRAIGVRLPASLKKRIKVPTVAFAGMTDIIAPEAYEPARRRFDGDYSIVRMPGGHFMHREHPERFISELVGALEKRRATLA